MSGPAGRRPRSATIDEPDAALVARARDGDRDAMDTLLRRHHDRVYALCRRMTGNDADAADATQDALIAIVRGLPRFDGRAAFSTWAYRIAANACIDEHRRRARRPVPGLDDHAGTAGRITRSPSDGRTGSRISGGGDGPDLADRVADRFDIDAALTALPAEFRAAVVLRDQLGLDYAEIAAVLEIPPGTVRSRIARGRAALADRLREAGPVTDAAETEMAPPGNGPPGTWALGNQAAAPSVEEGTP
jgi:RNA polymerase sigma-70 factor (ECF subfamily)